MKRFLRYLAPNLVTVASVGFALSSLWLTTRGRFAEAAWFVIFSVVTDRLDGIVARAVKGTSAFGVQMDSFADCLNFGVAPGLLTAAYLSQPGSPLAAGWPRAAMLASSAFWVLAVIFRLARFNVIGDDPRCKNLFFGVPTTVMGGLICSLFLAFLKYGADMSGAPVAIHDEPRLLGDLRLGSSVWLAWPPIMVAGALLMVSKLRMPKPGLSRSRLLAVWSIVNLSLGYAATAFRRFPEFLVLEVLLYLVMSAAWGFASPELRKRTIPPLFPTEDQPARKPPARPEDDSIDEPEPEQQPAPGRS